MSENSNWYPVALSDGVETGSSSGTHLLGEEIVIWRDGTGAPHVWEDRCPHRGMRLSFGFVRSDRIACLYHGWQYGTDGRCLAVPAHPNLKVPPSITVWRHSCHEQLGMIWAHFREATGAPGIPVEATGEVLPIRSLHIDCPADVLAEQFASFDIAPFNSELADGSRSTRRDGSLIIVTMQNGGLSETLIGGVQPLDEDHSALHAVLAVSSGDYRGAGQLHFVRFVEKLRDQLETGGRSSRAQ